MKVKNNNMIRTYTLVQRWSDTQTDCHVHVQCRWDQNSFVFAFDVDESVHCFRLEHDHDGAECWEDSCVEVFLRSGFDPTCYFNFECNAGGYLLAEVGSGRVGRRRFDAGGYRQIHRHAEILSQTAERIHWHVEISIPFDMIGVRHPADLYGNLYKCASRADWVHYLSAFEISSPQPDFHRPDAFRRIF